LTERLYYADSYLTTFDAAIVEVVSAASKYHIYLDRTAFYPASGGQPCDTGRIAGLAVVDVVDEPHRIAHVLEQPAAAGPVSCQIDWDRRFDHMQQHSGQHLLSAVFEELFRFHTLSFHLGVETSTIDLDTAELSPDQVTGAERRANDLVFEGRPITVGFYSAEEAGALGLRKPSEREGLLRVVEIAGCDRSACGGTHVRGTGEIGPILIRRLDRVRQSVRVEFACGHRAVRLARADYTALSRAAQIFSAPPDQVPALVAAQVEAAKTAEKTRQKLEAELSVWQGRDLYARTVPDAHGRRILQTWESSGPLDAWRLRAQSYVASGPGAVFLVTTASPPALLLALSPDLGIHAGQLVREVVTARGGRGGGSPQVAQGSLPDAAGLGGTVREVLRSLTVAAL
jgi:alanyl-tRNA synthetase